MSAYIAKKLKKATDAASTALAAAPADTTVAGAAAEPAAAEPKLAAKWIESVGEPPRKNQVGLFVFSFSRTVLYISFFTSRLAVSAVSPSRRRRRLAASAVGPFPHLPVRSAT